MPLTNAMISGIVLAAGASRRLGRPKQLLSLDGVPLLRIVLDAALNSSLYEVIVVLGYHAKEIRETLGLSTLATENAVTKKKLKIAVCDEWGDGMSASLATGLEATHPEAIAAAILVGDQPHVKAELIDRVTEAFVAGDKPIARPVYYGKEIRIPGHPVLISRTMWPEVEKLRGDQGLRSMIDHHPEQLLEVSVEGEAPGDIDTLDDYRQLTEP